MAESGGIKPGESPSTGRIKQADAEAEASPSNGRKKNGGESPGSVRMKPHQSPSTRAAKYHAGAAGHSFRKVTLTKPTFCHHCSDFIWGLVGYVCEGMISFCFSICAHLDFTSGSDKHKFTCSKNARMFSLLFCKADLLFCVCAKLCSA